MQWIHKGSSCILLWSSMSKVSCLQIHKDRKEISSSFVTKEKIIFNRRPRIKNPICQIRLNDRLNINAELFFLFSWGVYDAATFLIPVSCRSLVCANCYTIIYGLAHRIQTQQRILELKETENYGLRFLLQLKGNWFRNNVFIKFQ